MLSTTDPQDVTLAGCEANVIAADMPCPVGNAAPRVAGEKIVHPIRGRQARRGGQDAHAFLWGERIEVHDDDDRVVVRALEIREEALVLGLEKGEVVEVLQRGIGTARGVE